MSQGTGGSVQGAGKNEGTGNREPGTGKNEAQRHRVTKAQRENLRKIIFVVLLIFSTANFSFAQKKDDDSKLVTRGQLAQMIVDTFPWLTELSNSNSFAPDMYGVEKTHPNYVAIEVSIKLGINETLTDGYKPGLQETRYTVVSPMLRLINVIESYYKIEFPLSISSVLEPFTDVARSYPLHDRVIELFEKGFINGYPDGTFKGRTPATIKEVKICLLRIKEKTEALLKGKKASQK